uniref:Ion transport domain-containing protein n=1 Tax=Haptolina ericina TaxID=156174 RepID=A0A7S3BYB3_9EUKA
MQLARTAECKEFLSSKGPQVLTSIWWRGHLQRLKGWQLITRLISNLLPVANLLPSNVTVCGCRLQHQRGVYATLSIPMVRFYLRMVIYVGYLGLYAWFMLRRLPGVMHVESICIDPTSPCDALQPSRDEIVVLLWALSQEVDWVHRYIYADDRQRFVNSFWNRLNAFRSLLVLALLACRQLTCMLEASAALPLYDVYLTGMSLLGVLLALMVVSFFPVLSENLGVLMVCLVRMVDDVLNFGLLLMVIIFGFTLSFQGIKLASHNPEAFGVHGGDDAIFVPFWGLYGLSELESVGRQLGAPGLVATWLFMLVGNVALINLMVAMMTSTFTSVKSKTQAEWRFEFTSIVMEHRAAGVFPIPPPFNFPILLYRLIVSIWDPIPPATMGSGKDIGRYLQVKELLKQDVDRSHSIETKIFQVAEEMDRLQDSVVADRRTSRDSSSNPRGSVIGPRRASCVRRPCRRGNSSLLLAAGDPGGMSLVGHPSTGGAPPDNNDRWTSAIDSQSAYEV